MPQQAEAPSSSQLLRAGGGTGDSDGLVVETACYYDGSLPAVDDEFHRNSGGCSERCSLDVTQTHASCRHFGCTEGGGSGRGRPTAAAVATRPALLFVHGGTWRVGHRRAPMFAGHHSSLARSYDPLVVVSVGYRRGRMPLHVFFGLYPAYVACGFGILTAPVVVAMVVAGWLPAWSAPLPALGLMLLYYVFWLCYPRGGGNCSSQCERGGGVGYDTMCADLARAVRWVHDHAPRLGIDRRRIFIVGHSAGAHLACLLATDGAHATRRSSCRLRLLATATNPPGACLGVLARSSVSSCQTWSAAAAWPGEPGAH